MRPKFSIHYLIAAVLLALAVNMFAEGLRTAGALIDYSDFKELVREGHDEDARVGSTTITGHADRAAVLKMLPLATRDAVAKRSKEGPLNFRTFRVQDEQLPVELERANVRYTGAEERNWLMTLLSWVAPVLFFAVIWMLMLGKGRGAGDLFGAAKSNARLLIQKNIGVRFSDVEGIDEAKAELMEVVEFLRKPDRYTRLGGAHSQRHSDRRRARYRQDAARQGRGRRSQRSVPADQRIGVRRDVRRRGRGACARLISSSRDTRAVHHLHR